MNDLLIDYALDQLDPAERARVNEMLRTDPAAAAKLARLTAALAPLEADREPDAPPPGLALAALSYTAEQVVERGLYTTADGFDPAVPVEAVKPGIRRLPFTREQVNAAVAASIAFLVVGIGLVGVQNVRHRYQTAACQNNLRELHAALTGYSETHGGRFPQAGTDTIPLAGAFLDELNRAGQPVSAAVQACPVRPTTGVGYAYSLGFRDPLGQLTGLRKPESADDYTPILADLPGDTARPPAHHGWNVLTVGGSVRLTTVSTIGVDGDDIFQNAAGERRAGLFRNDVSLGRPFDLP